MTASPKPAQAVIGHPDDVHTLEVVMDATGQLFERCEFGGWWCGGGYDRVEDRGLVEPLIRFAPVVAAGDMEPPAEERPGEGGRPAAREAGGPGR